MLPWFLDIKRKPRGASVSPGNDLPRDGGVTGDVPAAREPADDGTQPSKPSASALQEVVRGYLDQTVGGAADNATPRPPAAVRELAPQAARAYMSEQTRPRRASAPTPDETRGQLLRRVTPDPNAPVEDQPSPVMGAEPTPRPTAPLAAVNLPGLDTETTAMRPRWSSELNKETEHNLAERDAVAHPEERPGWFKRLAPLMARGFLAGSQRAGVLGGVGGAISGAVTGAMDSHASARAMHSERLARSDQRLAQLRGQRKEDAALAQTEAQTDWLRARPDIEGRKADGAALKRSQDALQREISNRLREPRPFDPADSYDAGLMERAQSLGVNFAPGMFGDFKNPAQLEVIDPSDPSGTRKTRLVYDRDSGQWQPLTVGGQGVTSGYTQPVNPDTKMTAFQEGTLALGERRADETEKQHGISNEFTREQLGLARGRLSLAQAALDNRFGEQDRKRFDAANKLAAQAEEYSRTASALDSHSTYIDPDDGKEKTSTRRVIDREKFAAKADAARRELFTSYRDVFTVGANGLIQMSTAEFKQMFPTLAAKTQGENIGVAQRLGVELTDGAPASPGAYTPSPIRPRAPRSSRPSSSAPPAPSKGRVSRANFDKVRAQNPSLQGKPDAEVEAALRAQGIEVY